MFVHLNELVSLICVMFLMILELIFNEAGLLEAIYQVKLMA